MEMIEKPPRDKLEITKLAASPVTAPHAPHVFFIKIHIHSNLAFTINLMVLKSWGICN